MSKEYKSPEISMISIELVQIISLSLTGGTEPMNQGDLEDLIIDDPFDL